MLENNLLKADLYFVQNSSYIINKTLFTQHNRYILSLLILSYTRDGVVSKRCLKNCNTFFQVNMNAHELTQLSKQLILLFEHTFLDFDCIQWNVTPLIWWGFVGFVIITLNSFLSPVLHYSPRLLARGRVVQEGRKNRNLTLMGSNYKTQNSA